MAKVKLRRLVNKSTELDSQLTKPLSRLGQEKGFYVIQQKECLTVYTTPIARWVWHPPYFNTPSAVPTFTNAAMAASKCARVCAALSWTRIRALPWGTTG